MKTFLKAMGLNLSCLVFYSKEGELLKLVLPVGPSPPIPSSW